MADGQMVNTRSGAILRSDIGTRAKEHRTWASLVNPSLMEQGEIGDGAAFLHGNLYPPSISNREWSSCSAGTQEPSKLMNKNNYDTLLASQALLGVCRAVRMLSFYFLYVF